MFFLIVVSSVIHIKKENNNLEESELLGVGSESYGMYEDLENLDEKFRKISGKILELKPKDVKKMGISKQTLEYKQKILLNKIGKISNKIKISSLQLLMMINVD